MVGEGHCGGVSTLSSLRRWGSGPSISPGSSADGPSNTAEHAQYDVPTYPVSAQINKKLILWKGDLTLLNVDAIVVGTNEKMNDMNGVSGMVRKKAGPGLTEECRRIGICRTGDAVITEAHRLPTKWIIHTVGPRWSTKYETAAEGALHSCYRRSFELLQEKKVESAAFCVINTSQKGYPTDDGAHVALRTIRRCMEKWGDSLHSLAIVINNDSDMKAYKHLMPLYFPRSKKEEAASVEALPEFIGNEFGERLIENRKIRIQESIPVSNVSSESEPLVRLYQPGMAPKSFGEFQPGPDDRDKMKSSSIRDHIREQKHARKQRVYERRLARSLTENFDDLESLKFLQLVGKDVAGRSIVVVSACRVPARSTDPDRLIQFVIRTLDREVAGPYVIVYFHSGCRQQNKPELTFFRRIHKALTRKYKKNLQNLYVVHPTIFVKMVTWFTRPFVKKQFKSKIRHVSRLSSLFKTFDCKQLRIPHEVLQHDHKVNGSTYVEWIDYF